MALNNLRLGTPAGTGGNSWSADFWPQFPLANRRCVLFGDPEGFSDSLKRFPGGGPVSDFDDLVLGQFGGGVSCPFAVVPENVDRMFDILFQCDDFKIFRAIVSSDSVLVVYLHSSGDRAVEGGRDKSGGPVRTPGCLRSVDAQTDEVISVFVETLAENAKRFDIVTFDDYSDTPECRSLINRFIPGDRFPFFHCGQDTSKGKS